MAYLFRIGGDHFEYRPLDFYWPTLAVPVSAGIICCSRQCVQGLDSCFGKSRMSLGGCIAGIFAVVLVCSSALQGVLLLEWSRTARVGGPVHIQVDENNAGWLLAVPGMSMVVAVSNDLRRQMEESMVAVRFARHRAFANQRIEQWSEYERIRRGVIPEDAVMAETGIGAAFYYLRDLRVIDLDGLTDATVARNPVTTPNKDRRIAHDRTAPAGYLEQRGVNIYVYERARSMSEALDRGAYALLVGNDLWMPFDSPDHAWVVSRFGASALVVQRNEEGRARVVGRPSE